MAYGIIKTLSAAALALTLAACGGDDAQTPSTSTPLVAKSFEVVMNPAPGRPAAGYGVITGPADAMLTSVTSSEAGRIELHIIERQGTVAKMKKVDGLLIDSSDSLSLAKGGAHLMIFDLAEDAGEDNMVPLTLTFDTGATLSVEAKVTN